LYYIIVALLFGSLEIHNFIEKKNNKISNKKASKFEFRSFNKNFYLFILK